jgi:hypothetical protein
MRAERVIEGAPAKSGKTVSDATSRTLVSPRGIPGANRFKEKVD